MTNDESLTWLRHQLELGKSSIIGWVGMRREKMDARIQRSVCLCLHSKTRKDRIIIGRHNSCKATTTAHSHHNNNISGFGSKSCQLIKLQRLGVTLTNNGVLSCNSQTFCSMDQSSLLPSASSKSKCQRTLHKIRFISAHARLLIFVSYIGTIHHIIQRRITYGFPKQFLGPTMNGSWASFRSASNLGSASGSQRSGTKVLGSTKLSGERVIVFPGMPTRV